MELEDAYAIRDGEKMIEDLDKKVTVPELAQLLMGACLTNAGDIICLKCGFPNECCKCEE